MDDKTTGHTDEQPVNRLDILFLIRAYNRHEITLEEWLRQTKAWAEAVINQSRPTDGLMPLRKPAAPD